MLRLHGFASSNYYNVVKLALLEKGLPFEEALVYIGANEHDRPEYLAKSPLAKIPALETAHGFVSESRCILDYLDAAYPEPSLLPKSAFDRAKVRELAQVVELYLELAARPLIGNLLTGKEPHPVLAREVRSALAAGVKGLARLTSFEEFAWGNAFGEADLACIMHLPLVRLVTRKVLKEDPLAALPGVEAYLARMKARPAVQRIRADADADAPAFLAHVKRLFAAPPAG